GSGQAADYKRRPDWSDQFVDEGGGRAPVDGRATCGYADIVIAVQSDAAAQVKARSSQIRREEQRRTGGVQGRHENITAIGAGFAPLECGLDRILEWEIGRSGGTAHRGISVRINGDAKGIVDAGAAAEKGGVYQSGAGGVELGDIGLAAM